MLQLVVLAAVAIFLVLRLRSALGTRDGFEPEPGQGPEAQPKRRFDVIEGGIDQDIQSFAELDSPTGRALAEMKRSEPGFSVNEFAHGARQAYEMILMAYESGDLETLNTLLAPHIYEAFSRAIEAREDKGLVVEAEFLGVRELSLKSATFDAENREAEITMHFLGEMTSVVRDAEGQVVEGDHDTIKRQSDVWTFARLMGGENPAWLLVDTSA